MYSTVNGVSYITGDFGKYDNKVKDNSVRYGRNSVDNYTKYLSDYIQPTVDMEWKTIKFNPVSRFKFVNRIVNFFKTKKLEKQLKKLENQIQQMKDYENRRTPLKFVRKYMPGDIKNGDIDTQALMGASYEELGQNTSVDVDKITKFIQQGHDEKMTAEALDINNDGKVSVDEYSASILVCDALSESDKLSTDNINGIVNNKGENTSFAFSTEKNKEIAKEIYTKIYNHFNLGKAKEKFLSNKNNLVKQPTMINFLS